MKKNKISINIISSFNHSNLVGLLKNNKSGIVCLISKTNNKASIVIAVDKKITDKYNAVKMVNFISDLLGGKGGGGRPDMAQSGGSMPDKSEEAINKLKEYIIDIY